MSRRRFAPFACICVLAASAQLPAAARLGSSLVGARDCPALVAMGVTGACPRPSTGQAQCAEACRHGSPASASAGDSRRPPGCDAGVQARLACGGADERGRREQLREQRRARRLLAGGVSRGWRLRPARRLALELRAQRRQERVEAQAARAYRLERRLQRRLERLQGRRRAGRAGPAQVEVAGAAEVPPPPEAPAPADVAAPAEASAPAEAAVAAQQ